VIPALSLADSRSVPVLRDSDDERPYKGLDSFQIEDGPLFFGRDRESDQLIAKILSTRLTVLHAQSGAGKTAIINARVIPGLEQRGWTAVRVLPENDPVRVIQTRTFLQLLTPPAAERTALERAWETLDAPTRLGELLESCDRLPPWRKVALAAAVAVPPPTPWFGLSDLQVHPWFCRLLRGTLDGHGFEQHLRALADFAGEPSVAIEITRETAISDIFQCLTSLNRAYHDAVPDACTESRSLRAFFNTLLQPHRWQDAACGAVVLFDQAEELFTRFVDRQFERGEGPDWRLKWEFFSALEELLAPGEQALPTLPFRFVISLRSEYLAQLDPVRSFAWDLDASSYHLGMLRPAQAVTAIREPARLFNYGYSEACVTHLVAQLAREERYVEPSQLQIVCDFLWKKKGRELAIGPHAEGETPEVQDSDLEDVGRIVQEYLHGFLDEVGRVSRDDRLETLELLEHLVTRSGTRNILDANDLTRVRFREVSRRHRLLALLKERRIVREEGRLGGRFVEITHEFLVGAILEAIRELPQDPDYSRLRWALDTLEQWADTVTDLRSASALRVPQLLAIHDNRTRIVLSDWVRHLMLRSVLLQLDALPEYRRHDVLLAWVAEAGNISAVSALSAAEIAASIAGPTARISVDELEVLNRARGELDGLTGPQMRAILRTELMVASDRERGDIVAWVERLVRHDNSPEHH
jgi:hypothetical protein